MTYFDAKAAAEIGLRDWVADRSAEAPSPRYDEVGVGATRRREFIVGAAGTVASLAGDPLITALDRLNHLADSALGVAVDGYEAALAELVLTYSQLPVELAHARLDALLGHAQHHLGDIPPAAYRGRLLSLAGWTAQFLAMACYDLGEVGAANLNTMVALEYARQVGDDRLTARTRDRQALVASDNGNLVAALEYARQGVAVVPARTGVAVGVRGSFAMLNAKMGHLDEARATLRDMDADFAGLPPSEIGEGSGSCTAERFAGIVGFILGQVGELDAAEGHLTVAAEHYARTARPTRLAMCQFDLADVLLRDDRPAEAVATAVTALDTPRPVTPVRVQAASFERAMTARHPELAEARQFRERYLALEAGPPTG